MWAKRVNVLAIFVRLSVRGRGENETEGAAGLLGLSYNLFSYDMHGMYTRFSKLG